MAIKHYCLYGMLVVGEASPFLRFAQLWSLAGKILAALYRVTFDDSKLDNDGLLYFFEVER